MTQEGFKRKLIAILSADVEGYSRLMGENEDEATGSAKPTWDSDAARDRGPSASLRGAPAPRQRPRAGGRRRPDA